MKRFDTRKEAEVAQNALIKDADELARRKTEAPTIAEAVDYWLNSRKATVGEHTYRNYVQLSRDWIIGPAFQGTMQQRRQYGLTGKKAPGTEWVTMFGRDTKVDRIKTAEIRSWLLQVRTLSTPYVAKTAAKALSSILRLIEEDYDIRLARMPSRAGAAYRRQQRQLLTEDQTKLVLEAALQDHKWGVYYAFAFLTGTRPNEQLGLLWEDVDLIKGRVRIHRSQLANGTLKPFTKTDAGMREIPLNSMLLQMLKDWHERCPRLDGKLYRVFPAQADEKNRGRKAEEGSDGGLSLHNYRNRVWYPMLKRLGLPQIPPYAARHMAISYLQSQGVEVGLVAKIAGHANAQVTLQYYTHAVRDSEGMMDHLTAAYGMEKSPAANEAGVQI